MSTCMMFSPYLIPFNDPLEISQNQIIRIVISIKPLSLRIKDIRQKDMRWIGVPSQKDNLLQEIATDRFIYGIPIKSFPTNHPTPPPPLKSYKMPTPIPEKESVEDIQWSPTESTVLASAHCHGGLKIYDTRRAKQAMLTHSTTSNGVDLNVIAWNHNVSNLLATGADDGVFSVWDLRTFSSNAQQKEPLARFTCHNTPITSLEWHPTDESMILVSDDNGAYVYDLSIETDDVDTMEQTKMNGSDDDGDDEEIPPQLLFVHAGSSLVKECHWHPQIPSLIMSTAQTGFSVFVPSNL